MPNAPKISPKQARFVQEYLVDANGAGAAVRAGYGAAGAHVAASRLLRNANVHQALEARQQADATRLSMKRENVLAGLLEAVHLARDQMNPAGMVAGLREIGKLMGFYAPEVRRVELTTGQDAAQADFGAMSDGELLALIEQGAATV